MMIRGGAESRRVSHPFWRVQVVFKVCRFPNLRTVFLSALADIGLPSLVVNDEAGPGLDDDCSIADGEAGAGGGAEPEDCFAL